MKLSHPGPRAWGVAALAVVLAVLALSPVPVVALREQVFDFWQRVSPRERISAPVTIVTIDDESLAARGLWPWPRDLTAQLIEAIASYEPAVIGVDILFPEPERGDQTGDRRLKEALAKTRSVLAISGEPQRDRRWERLPRSAPFAVSTSAELPLRSFPGHTQSQPEMAAAAAGQGAITADQSSSGVMRRAIMVSRIGDVIVPSLSAEMLRVASGRDAFSLRRSPSGLLDLGIGDLSLPLQEDGLLWIRYSRNDPQRFVSADTVLAGRLSDPDLLRGKLVIVGFGATGGQDVVIAPTGEWVPGPEVHAQILEQIFDGTTLIRPAWARWAEWAWLLLSGALVIWLVPRVGAIQASALGLCGVAVPMGLGFGALGLNLLVDGANPALGFVGVLTLTFAATYFERDRMAQQMREAQAKVAGELGAAKRIQMGLLSDVDAMFAHESRIEIQATLEPARTVGGDFYECLRLDDNRIFIVVADVSGKGMPAALFMALSKAILKANALRERSAEVDVGEVVSRTNAEIAREDPESLFITAFVAIVDLSNGQVSYCNAGHEPPIARQLSGEIRRFDVADGPPLCVVDDFPYMSANYTLQPGEWICVVTDGITEAMNSAGALYGYERLRQTLERLPEGAGAREAARAVRTDVADFVREAEPSDDLTLLCIGWKGPDGRLNAR